MRDLYDKILDYKGEDIFTELLIDWVRKNSYKDFLLSVKSQLSDSTNNKFSNEVSWELYALSRVLDVLTLGFQTNNNKDGSDWLGPNISLEEYCEFIKVIGLEIKILPVFTPFYCEIIEAKEDSIDFCIKNISFPAVHLGNLVLKKAGVIVGLNTNNYNLSLVNNATIYWAFRRKNRKHQDLSHGWGHNSQWRTDFRFDLETEGSFIYNLYGSKDLSSNNDSVKNELKEQGLLLIEAIELTKNRHFITSVKNDGDLFPYDFKYVEDKKHITL